MPGARACQKILPHVEKGQENCQLRVLSTNGAYYTSLGQRPSGIGQKPIEG